MTVVLFQPEIPQNTGNIVRTCSATGYNLVLVRPLGFSISNRALKRAGLDYWDNTSIEVISSLEDYLSTISVPFYFFSSKAEKKFTEVDYPNSCVLIFGSETSGIPNNYWEKFSEHFVKIPMKKDARCLNLSNSVAVAIYEVLKQDEFKTL